MESAEYLLFFSKKLKCGKRIYLDSYIQSHRLLGPGLLHLVVHDGVVDAQATKDHKRLKTNKKMYLFSACVQRKVKKKTKKQFLVCLFVCTSKSRWSASSNGFPSSLFSTWATPVTQSQFIQTALPLSAPTTRGLMHTKSLQLKPD